MNTVVTRTRLWAFGGMLLAVLLLILGWVFAISPQNEETAELQDQAAGAEQRVIVLQRRLKELRAQNAQLPRYKEQLARDRAALPTTAGSSDFLRGIHAAGEGSGLTVSAVAVGTPTRTSAAGTTMYMLPISVTARGNTAQLGRFLDQVQQVQPRAALVTSATMATEGGFVTLNLGLNVFVAGGPESSEPAATTGSPAPGE